MSSDIKQNDSDNSKRIICDDSNTSITDNFVKNNKIFLDKGIDSAFKKFTTNIFNTINSTFANFNSEFEKKTDKSKENHDKLVEFLKSQLKKIESEKKKSTKIDKKSENSMKNISKNFFKLKWSSKIFQVLKIYHEMNKQKKRYDHIIRDSHFKKRKLFLIFNSWRNVTNSFNKIKIKSKYSEYYNENYLQIKEKSNAEILRLNVILEKLEADIQSEISQRHSLNKLYDLSMNQGVDIFIKETNNMIEFDTSNSNTPLVERSLNKDNN